MNRNRIVNRLISNDTGKFCFQDKTVEVTFHDTFMPLLTNYFNKGRGCESHLNTYLHVLPVFTWNALHSM